MSAKKLHFDCLFIRIIILFQSNLLFGQPINDSIFFEKIYQDQFNYEDSICKAEVQVANKHIKEGRLLYTHYNGMVESFESNIEMDSLLNLYGIETTFEEHYCTAIFQHCYSSMMLELINKKYGYSFIDSLRNVADNIYLTKPKIEGYYFDLIEDTNKIYKNLKINEFNIQFEKDLVRNFKYPVGYFLCKNDSYSLSIVEFILTTQSEIKKLAVGTTFKNKENIPHLKYVNEAVREYILNYNWVPYIEKGKKINAHFYLMVFHK